MSAPPRFIAPGLGLLLFGGALLYLAPLRHYGLLLNDDGWLLHPALRMLGGEVLYRDIWSYYAPLRYEFFAALFQWTGASLLAVRWVWLFLIALSAVGTYRIVLRLAPWWLAWLPGAVYAAIPGPWHKAPYGACTVGFFLLLVRALERPSRMRFAAVGFMVGVTLMTRQDLGIAQLGLTGLALLGMLAGKRITDRPLRTVLGWGAVAGAAAFVVAIPFLVRYASAGALGAYFEANFVSAFVQMGAHRSQFGVLLDIVSWGNLSPLIFIMPPFVYAVAFAFWIAQVRRDGFDETTILIGLMLLFATATLAQAYAPLRMLRLLQSAIPFYCLTTWVIARAWLGAGTPPSDGIRRVGALAVGGSLAGSLVWWVVAGAPVFLPDDSYSGSVRMRSLDAPVEFLEETFWARPSEAEEIRVLREFVATHTEPGEPVFVWPLSSLYYSLLDRPNPTRMIHEHIHAGDWAQPGRLKIEDMQRLLDAGTRYAVVDRAWLFWPEEPDVVRRALRAHFKPVREYGRMAVMERSSLDPLHRQLFFLYGRYVDGLLGATDRPMARRLAAAFPEEPLPHMLLGVALGRAGALDLAAAAFVRTGRLDRSNPNPWVQAAALRLAQGRTSEAEALLDRAEGIAPTPGTRAVRLQLEAAVRAHTPEGE